MNRASDSRTHRRRFVSGARQTLPIVFGYLPVGFAYGVLADKTGLSSFNTVLMSIIVFAGSAQLIAVSLIGAAAPVLSIIVTTFIVNLRHLLMSAALSPYLRGWPRRHVAAFTFELTDETFALHSTRMPGGADKVETFAINLTAQASWVAGTILGVAASGLIADITPIGLDYALPAMFIALLIMQVSSVTHGLVAIAGGLLSVALALAGADRWNVVIATILAATIGLGIWRWTRE